VRSAWRSAALLGALVACGGRPLMLGQAEGWWPWTPGRKRALLESRLSATRALVRAIEYKVDVNTLERHPAANVRFNEIARVAIRTLQPLFVDPYATNRATGSFILIDETTNNTLAAGMIEG
jgi:sulfate adenylyltransferase subunit 1 (EFTu-like GTPase family)